MTVLYFLGCCSLIFDGRTLVLGSFFYQLFTLLRKWQIYLLHLLLHLQQVSKAAAHEPKNVGTQCVTTFFKILQKFFFQS